MIFRNKIFFLLLIPVLYSFGCKNRNHIDQYKVNIDTLNLLPDGFYAYRRGNLYFHDLNNTFMIWMDRDNSGNVKNINNINYLNAAILTDDNIIDTLQIKIKMQKFVDLSRKYKFGHIYIDRENKFSFSYRDGLPEQYIMTLNDSMRRIYLSNDNFKLLKNGWFEYIEK